MGAAALLAASPQRAFSQALQAPAVSRPAKLFGVSVGGLPNNLAPLKAFEELVRKPVNFANYYADFTTPTFDDIIPTAMVDAGVEVMLTWQPTNWDYANPITLADILDGRHDDMINAWAQQIYAWGRPLMLRFAHEMNGNWYSWGMQGHNTPAEFRAVWRHVWEIFRLAGVTTVRWVWCPNIVGGSAASVAEFYPGDDYCEILGMDGFNYGSVGSSAWEQPDAVFGPTLNEIRALSGMPILICETGCVEMGEGWAGKYLAEWLDQFFAWLREAPVAGFSWFAIDNKLAGHNLAWNVDATPASLSAFRRGLATYI